MQESHINAARSFCVSTMVIRLQNQGKIVLILGLTLCAGFGGGSPAVISGSGNIGNPAQLGNA